MNKDELINRVLLLGSTLSRCVEEGVSLSAVIKDIDLETLRACADYFKTVVSAPATFAPYYFFYYAPKQGVSVEVRGVELKEKTVTTYE